MNVRLLPAFLFIIVFSLPQFVTAQLQSPAEFLGYELGDRYTPHHRVLSYVEHVAEESDWVTIHHYGKTNQHRELVYLVVTTPANHANIEEIRTNNLKLTGLMEGEPTANKKAITWLSYNIHGNETSSSEAAMNTLYKLVSPDNEEAAEWLANSVVIIDPMLNPDGRDRYVNWFNGIVGAEYAPQLPAREHHEPWPGGRSNHYYFDLNRDWAWQTQIESQQRGKIYQEWMPHVHVDFHEQSYNAPYYFAPAAEPFHKAITDWQREFQTTIGENNIRYFDEQGWHYFTRERFDLFYPSYGDTWPTFNGAIGMTYEQAGHSLGGAAIITQEGDTLTLADRLRNHTVTGLSTVEVTAQHSERVVEEFAKQFERGMTSPDGQYKTFVVKADNHPDKIYNLLSFLDTHEIRYGRAGSSARAEGYNYRTGNTGRVQVDADDIIISAYQPKSTLARVFFEPNPELADSVTYDITSWEAHYRFGLEGYALESRINPGADVSADDFRNTEITGVENPYAWLLPWNSMDDAQFLAEITRHDLKSRFTVVPIRVDGKDFDRGTLVITRENNKHLGDRFHEIIRKTAEKHSRTVHGASTGFVETGVDFGSANVRFIEKPEIAVFIGEGTSSLQAGEVWHFLDQQLNYPATMLHTDHMGRADLSDYNTIVLPSGNYSDQLTEGVQSRLMEWVQRGGTLIVMGNANGVISRMDGSELSRKTPAEQAGENDSDTRLRTYGDRIREATTNRAPGAIYRTTLDNTHPLAFGYGDEYFSIKVGADAYDYLGSGWNVATVQENAHMSGFVGHRAKENLEHTLTFGVQNTGSGQVVYMIDNPLFRGFWENGKLFFVNALFFVKN